MLYVVCKETPSSGELFRASCRLQVKRYRSSSSASQPGGVLGPRDGGRRAAGAAAVCDVPERVRHAARP